MLVRTARPWVHVDRDVGAVFQLVTVPCAYQVIPTIQPEYLIAKRHVFLPPTTINSPILAKISVYYLTSILSTLDVSMILIHRNQ